MNMKRYISNLQIALIGALLLFACTESYLGIEQVKTSSVKPDKITVNEVKPKSGGLEIHFSLPKGNPNIEQVVAAYINKQGEKMEFTVSRYSSSVLVEGMTGTNEIAVELICIDSSGNKSDITVVKAVPLLSPIEIALQSMSVEPAFGGVKIIWQNLGGHQFAIHVLTEDTLQKGVVSFVEDPSKTIYTSDSVKTLAYIRPYPYAEKKFGFSITDKWGNRSDTLIAFITPYKEQLVDYNRVKAVTFFNPTLYGGNRDYATYGINPATGIQNDGNAHGASFAPQTMFNGVKTGSLFLGYKFVKNLSDPDPANRVMVQDYYLTFDLNMYVRLSRVKIYPRTSSSYTYKRSSPKRFRIWGTDDANNERWSKFPGSWTLIGEYVGKDPVNPDSLTPEEITYFNENQEYLISEENVNPDAYPTTLFRYMRLQLMESYNKNEGFYTINEFQMYGDIQE